MLSTQWQVGDGREEALADYVIEHAHAGDVGDAIRVVDEFCYMRSFMINVGDEKGALLDAAVRRTSPRLVLELGTYCGYSALRIARALAGGRPRRLRGVQRRERPRRATHSRARPRR